MLFKHQYGFRRNKSTTQAILWLLQNIYSALDDDNFYFTMFLDLRKAFDCVSHDVLLNKLYFYGIRGTPLESFRSYLGGRSQFVAINGMKSDCKSISCGVPQGSILGPLLFLIFVNDLPNCNVCFDYVLFADDTSISLKFPKCSLDTIHLHINQQLCSVSDWLNANKISLNISKTNYMIFSYTGDHTLHSVRINGGEIGCVRSARYLGLFFDNNLKFRNHVDMLSDRISKSIGQMSKVGHLLPRRVLVSIYYSIIHPYLNYCVEAWFNAASCVVNRLVILQKRSIRLLVGAHYLDHTDVFFNELKILKLKSLFVLNIGCYMFKCINLENYDDDLLLYINDNIDQHAYPTRGR